MLLTSYHHHKDPHKETGESEMKRGQDGKSRGKRDLKLLHGCLENGVRDL